MLAFKQPELDPPGVTQWQDSITFPWTGWLCGCGFGDAERVCGVDDVPAGIQLYAVREPLAHRCSGMLRRYMTEADRRGGEGGWDPALS